MRRILFYILYLYGNLVTARTTLINFQMCDDKDYPIKLMANITNDGQYQMLHIEAILNITVDNRLMSIYTIEFSPDGVDYKRLFAMKNKFCNGINLNFGETAYKLMRAAGLPHKCPIPKGHYVIPQQLLDYSSLRIPLFPIGYLKMIMTVIDEGKNVVHCNIAELYTNNTII